MSLNLILALVTALVMFVFTAYVLQRYYARRKLYFLFWGLGLAMFGVATLAGALLAVSWNRWVFFSWYLFGAILTAAWIGQGTVYLLVRKRRAHILTIILITASIVAVFMLLAVMPDLAEGIFVTSEPISEQYREILPAISDGGYVRLSTIFFNIYGTITLVGGALFSTYLFWRKRVLPNRAIGNILIAVGALIIASASTLTRIGYGSLLVPGQLLAAVLMFSGFLVAAAPKRSPVEDDPEPSTAPAGQ
jgi:drug/metabolite transporter (DMT)-like permease